MGVLPGSGRASLSFGFLAGLSGFAGVRVAVEGGERDLLWGS